MINIGTYQEKDMDVYLARKVFLPQRFGGTVDNRFNVIVSNEIRQEK